MLIHVIAGSREQYESFVRDLNLDRREWRYSHLPEHIQGAAGSFFITVGEFWKNPVWDRGHEFLLAYGMRRLRVETEWSRQA